tara:strand:- start:35 stop:217 length:183 start_codon:yes stop_codon:yes gene_type:complete
MKKVTISSKNISQKQWSSLLLELNLIKTAWKPYAELDIQAHGLKNIIAAGQRTHNTIKEE